MFCPFCARKVLKGKDDAMDFSMFIEVVRARTEGSLLECGKQMVVDLLQQDTDDYPENLLIELAIWEPTVTLTYEGFAKSIKAKRDCEAKQRKLADEVETRKKLKHSGRPGVGQGLSRFSKGKVKKDYGSYEPIRLAPQLALEWAQKGQNGNMNPFASAPATLVAPTPRTITVTTNDGDTSYVIPDDKDTVDMPAPDMLD